MAQQVSIPSIVDQNAIERIAEALGRIAAHLERDILPPSSVEESPDLLLQRSPIASFLRDEAITDILVNAVDEIYINRSGVLQRTDTSFRDEEELERLAHAIASSLGRALDPRRPMVDARLSDGSRVNIIAPPMAVRGIAMSIRKFSYYNLTLEKLVERGELSEDMAHFLGLAAKSRANIIISGGTGTGKTTLLNAISRYIPETERIITIEDTAELRLQQHHVVQLETKQPPNPEAREQEVSAADLVRNALRMRPDRILVGEVRGDEVYDMLQAMNTGHEGSMTTVHANSPRHAIMRLENMLGPRMPNTSAGTIRQQIGSTIHLIIQLETLTGGKRVIRSIAEIVGNEGDTPMMQDIFIYEPLSHTGQGVASGRFSWTGITPRHQALAELVQREMLFALPPNETNLLQKLTA